MQDRTRAQEKQGFEQGVVEHVEQCAGKAEGRHQPVAGGDAEHAQAETEQDDADVLNGGVRQQPLEVMLAQGMDHAENARGHAEQEDGLRKERGRVAEQQVDADDAVDAHLDHHPGEQGRDVAGRGRVGVRQPDVQRQDARLGAEAGQGEEEHRALHPRGHGRHTGEGERAGGLVDQAEGGQNEQGAGLGEQEIDGAGPAGLSTFEVVEHQAPGGDRHQLPGDGEGHHVAGQGDQGHGHHEQAETERADRGPPGGCRFVQVVVGVEGEHRRNEQHRQQEQGGDRVEGEDERAEAEPAPAGGQGLGRRPGGLQADEPGQAACGDAGQVEEPRQPEPAVDDQRQDAANQDQGQGREQKMHRRSLASSRLGRPGSGPDHGQPGIRRERGTGGTRSDTAPTTVSGGGGTGGSG